MKSADAIALFSAYTAVIAIATVYQTLALQSLGAEGERLDDDIKEQPQAAFASGQHARGWWLLAKAAVVVVGTAVVVFLLAAWSDEIAVLIDPSDGFPQSALTKGTMLLRVLYVATCVVFAYALVRHDFVTDLWRKRT